MQVLVESGQRSPTRLIDPSPMQHKQARGILKYQRLPGSLPNEKTSIKKVRRVRHAPEIKQPVMAALCELPCLANPGPPKRPPYPRTLTNDPRWILELSTELIVIRIGCFLLCIKAKPASAEDRLPDKKVVSVVSAIPDRGHELEASELLFVRRESFPSFLLGSA